MSSRSHCLTSLRASALAILLCWASASRAAAGNVFGLRQIMPLDAGWRFMLGDDPAARQPGFDDSKWRTLGRRAVSRDLYVTTWSLPFAPGTLSAVGYRAGQPVAWQKLVTAGSAARLQLTAIPAPLARELAFYEVMVVDQAGQRVFDAAPAVTVKIEGPGRLAGLDTGDVTYGGLFKTNTREAWQGRLLATVRRTPHQGEIRVPWASRGSATLPRASRSEGRGSSWGSLLGSAAGAGAERVETIETPSVEGGRPQG